MRYYFLLHSDCMVWFVDKLLIIRTWCSCLLCTMLNAYFHRLFILFQTRHMRRHVVAGQHQAHQCRARKRSTVLRAWHHFSSPSGPSEATRSRGPSRRRNWRGNVPWLLSLRTHLPTPYGHQGEFIILMRTWFLPGNLNLNRKGEK